MPTLGFVQQTTKDTRRVEVRPGSSLDHHLRPRRRMGTLPAHKIDASVDSDQSTCVHVTDHAVVLDGEVAPRLGATGSSRMNC